MLRSRTSRREDPLGASMSDAIVSREDRADPEQLDQLELTILEEG